ncbi:MAG TPA: hypothetical protein VHB51_02445 [Candidatus Saccharimonadales bacterium]|nr:hypothetical protein [Candidatus Saccharimonadales bacterium]
MAERHQLSLRRKLATTVITLVVIAGLVVLADHLKTQSSAVAASPSAQTIATSPSNSISDEQATSSASYKDGSYTASESYFVPPGQESIQVNLTITNGVVTDSSVANSENDRESAIFQQEFASAYKNQVVGRAISALNISSISGASDTTRAFNDALDQIRHEAET